LQISQVTAGSVRVKLGRHLGPDRHGHHGRDELPGAGTADGPGLSPVSRASREEWLVTAGEFIWPPTG